MDSQSNATLSAGTRASVRQVKYALGKIKTLKKIISHLARLTYNQIGRITSYRPPPLVQPLKRFTNKVTTGRRGRTCIQIILYLYTIEALIKSL